MAGFTTSHAIDPLALPLTAGHLHSVERRVSDVDLDPRDTAFINPTIAFAVNQEVTLTYGLQWRWWQQDQHDHQNQGIRTTQTQMEFGVGYA